jgi:phosphoglucosamine mutase
MPTPAVSYLTQTFHADIGIVISASHNPHHDNGIKFFDAQGKKISDEIEFAIEQAFESPMAIDYSIEDLAALGKAVRINDAAGRYIEFCKSTYRANGIRLDGLKLVVDCAHGATYHIAPSVFRELGAKVDLIGVQPDGLNINYQCGATELSALIKRVVETNADLGLAYDGDGDRLMMVDRNGRIVDGDDILFLLAVHQYQEQPGVVGTLMTNLGVEAALRSRGFELIRAKVGDRYVMQELVARDWKLGAEGSGHILCLDKIGTGDGIVASLQVLSVIQRTGRDLSELLADVEKYPMKMINVKVKQKFNLDNSPEIKQVIQELEFKYSNELRVLIRASGTEPLVRVMVEGLDESLVLDSVEKLAEMVRIDFS